MTLDQNFADLDIFKKSKKITFFATCYYTLDFSKLTEDDITINTLSNTININIDKPDSFDVIIDENKTVYSETELGLLCFRDIKIQPEKYGKILQSVTKSFEDKMGDNKLYDQCLSNANKIIENLLLDLTNESYKVKISFKT